MGSLIGSLLIASPQLRNSPFSRTVVLMVQHNEQGAVGVVLNRTINETVQGLWKQISGDGCPSDQPVNMGGPVSGPLIALHLIKPQAELEILGGLYLASSKEHLAEIVKKDDFLLEFYTMDDTIRHVLVMSAK